MKSPSPTEQQFDALIAENRPKLLKICRVYAWNPTERDDLYQEILVQLWRSLPGLKEQRYANTWLYRVALNTAISFVRKDRSKRDHVVAVDGEQLNQVAAPDRDCLEQDQQFALLLRSIAQLNAVDKAAITLFLENLSYEQIAAVMGLSESNVGVILHRAKKKLSELMKHQQEVA